MRQNNFPGLKYLPPLRFDRVNLKIYGYSILTGLVSGIVVVAYRASIGWIEHLRATRLSSQSLSPATVALWLGFCIAGGWVASLLVKKSPLIKGSGIPQVKAFLQQQLKFDWKRELPYKFLGGVLALGAGLSLGREGPSIQLGALAGSAVDQKLGRGELRHFLATAGAAAGISAAFNAPLAGVLFCVEELHRNISSVLLTSTLIASFTANAVMWAAAGNAAIFSLDIGQTLPLGHYFTCVLGIGIATGLLGSLFNAGLLGFQKAYARLVPQEGSRIISAFAVAALVSLVAAPITGGGGELVGLIARGNSAWGMIALLLAGKFVFTLFSYASGAPGGIFLPMLSLGALVGALIHGILPEILDVQPYLINFILLGMTGFFVAVVRAPITGAVLITEMAGSFAHFPAFIFVSIIATAVAELLGTRPIYDSLLARLLPEASEGEASKSGS